VEVPEAPIVRLVGESVHARPVVGETVGVRITVPVNPFTGKTVIVEVPVEPATNARLVGLAVIVKSFSA
jgi:hypothetical protein